MTRVSIWSPLLLGTGVIAGTIVIHAAAVVANVRIVRHERELGHFGARPWRNLGIVAAAVMIALLAHLIEIGAWAALLVEIAEFQSWEIALYHSAMNYTTLGYGDIVMSAPWSLLGPIEAINGLLMFGVSTAMIFAVVQHLLQARFPDLRS